MLVRVIGLNYVPLALNGVHIYRRVYCTEDTDYYPSVPDPLSGICLVGADREMPTEISQAQIPNAVLACLAYSCIFVCDMSCPTDLSVGLVGLPIQLAHSKQ